MKDWMFYIKTTETCNLNCDHCFTSGKNGAKVFFDPTAVANWCLGILEHDPRPTHFEFHGGEPFLAPVEDMVKFYELTKHTNSSYGCTSNLVHKLTDEKMEFMKTVLNKRIGTSWDPKIRFENEKQIELWESNVRYLLSEGFVIKVFVSLTRDVVDMEPIDLLRYMKDLGVQEVAIERVTSNGYAAKNLMVFPSNIDMQHWFLKLHQQTVEHEARGWFDNEFLESVYTKFETGHSGSGTFCRDCEQKMFTINATGTIAGCPNSAPEAHYATLDDNPTDVLKNTGRCGIIAQELSRDLRCYGCPVYKYCNGDCHQLEWEEDICAAPKLLMMKLNEEYNGIIN